jgi:ribonuclease Y
MTFPLLLAFGIGGGSLYVWIRYRTHQTYTDQIKQFQSESQKQIDHRTDVLEQEAEMTLKRVQNEIELQQERDQSILEDLNHDLNRLDRIEKGNEERNQAIDEHAQRLAEIQDEHSITLKQIRGTKKRLKQKDRSLFLKLEERGEILHRDLKEEVKQQLYEQTEIESQQRAQHILTVADSYQDKKAHHLISLGCQRYFDPRPAERLVGYVDLPDKPKIRERILHKDQELIKEIQEITQVDFSFEEQQPHRLLIRNAPESYTREIARLSFNRWIKSGQLTLNAFKQHHKKMAGLIEKEAKRAGKAAAARLDLRGIHPEILFLLGKLLFRTSYTQNQWTHAIESAEICGMMAEELGIDIALARRATLLHDIGKVLWEETEKVGSHAVSGAAFAKEYGEIPEVVHPIAAHHQDEAPASALAYLVIAADTLSGARPGARRETTEAFSQHVEQLDGLCSKVQGVRNHMVIQGGREIRLFIDPYRHGDVETAHLTQNLAEHIEDECVFPGQVKITALREVIATTYARSNLNPYEYVPNLLGTEYMSDTNKGRSFYIGRSSAKR